MTTPTTQPLVLIVDDDIVMRMLARETLEQAGFAVEEAEDGQAGLEAFERLAPDLVLLDVMMPVLDGFEACAALRKLERGAHVPVLMMTGLDDPESINRVYEVGATDFITKPIALPMLGYRVNYVLRANRAFQRVHQLAMYDTVTGLPNRHLFREQLQHAIGLSERAATPLVMLSVDLDRFKRINDTLGHEVGDQLLREAGSRITDTVRQSDVVSRPDGEAKSCCVARQGGDEFIVLLPGLAEAHDAAKVARRLLAALAEPFHVAGAEIVVGANVGIAVHPLDGGDAETLLKNADAARSYARQHGQNQYEYYNASMNTSAVGKLALESNLRRALDRNEFSLFYQPKIDLENRAIVGVEALIRWRHPELGLVSPVEFIPLAEETGLVVPIGHWVLRTACAQIRTWRDRGLAPVPIAINLSARQFHQHDICEIVTDALREYGVPPHLLELEITESAAMKDAEATSETLARLKAIGVRIAIDDFGTGYSSLSYLKRFPIDSLKIDRSFVTELPCNQDDASIAQAVITMGHALRLKIVAEGVENEAQLDFLAANSCDEMQGYFFSRPLPADECTRLLAASGKTERRPGLRIAAAG